MSDQNYWPQTMLTLIIDLKAGKPDAWDKFVAIYLPLILRYCRRRRLSWPDAEEVGQEVLLRISRAIPKFEYNPGIGRFRGWIGQIVRRELARFVVRYRDRSLSQPNFVPEEFLESNTESAWQDEVFAFLVEKAFEIVEREFPPDQWACFYECWKTDQKPGVVAERLGIPADQVYRYRYLVRQRLQEVLRDLLDGDS